jgi:outer membrane protein
MGKISLDPQKRLLEAGLKLFANRGYAGTSVQDIIKEARVTKPTLYYYFENKEGLFQALVDHAMDERLRLMRAAAPPEKSTVAQLTDIIATLIAFARRQPDLLRLCFSIAFAAEGEFPSGVQKRIKMSESYLFVREVIQSGLNCGVLNPAYSVDELTQGYFQLVQHSIVMTIVEPKFRQIRPRMILPPRMEPERIVELFLGGSAKPKTVTANDSPSKRSSRLAKAIAIIVALCASPIVAKGQTTNTPPPETNASPNAASPVPDTSAATPVLPDVRPIPQAVRASHPELATVSPIAQNAKDPHALDLQTCFQLTAIRDDSLKISVEDIEIARAQLSQSIAALWPTFTATNQQQFLHYLGTNGGLSFTSFGVPVGGAGGAGSSIATAPGNRNYESQSHVTMNYTLFNGGQNWNNVGASAHAVAAKRQTLARDYQTIYQDVAQAFYNVLQYQGDMNVEADLIDGLKARVDDLRDRVNLGRSRPSELLQAQTDFANAKVTFEQQRGSANSAKETLAFYIGLPAAGLVLKDTEKFPTAAQLAAYIQHSPSRPDVLSQVESLRQAERNLSVAEGQLWPTVSASGDYLASQDPVSNSIDATMTIEVSMPIFDGGLIIGQIHQNKEMVRQSRLNVEQLQRTADEDTRTAYANFDASVAQVVVLREAAVLAARNLEAQVDDYRRGVVANLDVLTALQDYQTARVQLHNANMQARLNLINLHVAAGMAARGPGANNQALPTSQISTGTGR